MEPVTVSRAGGNVGVGEGEGDGDGEGGRYDRPDIHMLRDSLTVGSALRSLQEVPIEMSDGLNVHATQRSSATQAEQQPLEEALSSL